MSFYGDFKISPFLLHLLCRFFFCCQKWKGFKWTRFDLWQLLIYPTFPLTSISLPSSPFLAVFNISFLAILLFSHCVSLLSFLFLHFSLFLLYFIHTFCCRWEINSLFPFPHTSFSFKPFAYFLISLNLFFFFSTPSWILDVSSFSRLCCFSQSLPV